MYLRDLAIHADKTIAPDFPSQFVSWFHRETCCITDFYRSMLKRRVSTAETAKVQLVFVMPGSAKPAVRHLLGVAEVQWDFDFHAYLSVEEHEKKLRVLDSLQAALLWIAGDQNWSFGGLDDCYSELSKRNLEFEGWSKRSWRHPSKPLRAKIGFLYATRRVDFFVGVFDGRGREKARKALGWTVPEMGIAEDVLRGAGRWGPTGIFRYKLPGVFLRLPKTWQVNLSGL